MEERVWILVSMETAAAVTTANSIITKRYAHARKVSKLILSMQSNASTSMNAMLEIRNYTLLVSC